MKIKITIVVESKDADGCDIHNAAEESLEGFLESMRSSLSDDEGGYEILYDEDSGEGLTVEEIDE